MSDTVAHKLAMIFALFSFGFVTIGSIFSGATYITAFSRGAVAFLLFGGAAFGLLRFMIEEETEEIEEDAEENPEKENA